MKFLKLFFILSFATLIVLSCKKQEPSLDEMIGQMLVVGIGKEDNFNTVLNQVKNGEVGGVIFFERDIIEPQDITLKIGQVKSSSKKNIPFIAIDQEGGAVARINSKNGFSDFQSPKNVATTKTPQEAYSYYFYMAQTLKNTGFNINFAPCIDLAVNKNSIIAKRGRSFGKSSKVVTEYAKEFSNAHHQNKIATSLKHFPGHGSPTGDTHLGLVDATNTWKAAELAPYKNLLKNSSSLETVMVSHIFNTNWDGKYPASLSKNVVGKMLREDLKFSGVVFTDDLDMGAIRNNYTLDDIVVNAINAGCDVMIFSNYNITDLSLPKKVRKIIKRAIKNGKIAPERIEQSYTRIIELKKQI
jgi:beta-N-acetylhexosaminidase